jgi:hypothetical protein
MDSKQIDKDYDLNTLSNSMVMKLKDNDYIERSIGVFGEDYIGLKVKSEWKHSKDYGSNAHVTLTVLCKKEDLKNIKSQIQDDDNKDSIDSGCEDELRDLIQEKWGDLDFEWGYAGTKIVAEGI